jgi:hypothetical protein
MLGALMQGTNDRRRYKAEAEELRKTRFVEERRAVYVRYLAAFAEWEPLRAEAWRLRDEMDHAQDRVAAERRWQTARSEAEPSFRRFLCSDSDHRSEACKGSRDPATY